MCTRMGCLVEPSALPIISNSRVRVRTKRSVRCKRTLRVALVFVGDAAIISRNSPVKPVPVRCLQVYTMAFRRALNVLFERHFRLRRYLVGSIHRLYRRMLAATANCPSTRQAHPTNGHSPRKVPGDLHSNRQSFQHSAVMDKGNKIASKNCSRALASGGPR